MQDKRYICVGQEPWVVFIINDICSTDTILIDDLDNSITFLILVGKIVTSEYFEVYSCNIS